MDGDLIPKMPESVAGPSRGSSAKLWFAPLVGASLDVATSYAVSCPKLQAKAVQPANHVPASGPFRRPERKLMNSVPSPSLAMWRYYRGPRGWEDGSDGLV